MIDNDSANPTMLVFPNDKNTSTYFASRFKPGLLYNFSFLGENVKGYKAPIWVNTFAMEYQI